MQAQSNLRAGACDWLFWKRKSPLLSVRLGLFSSKKLFCLFHSASRRESEKTYKDDGHGTKIFSGNSVKWNNELWNLYDSCNSDQNEWRVQFDHNTAIHHFLQEFQFASRASQYRLISSGCSIHRLRRALYREPLLLPEETNRTLACFGADQSKLRVIPPAVCGKLLWQKQNYRFIKHGRRPRIILSYLLLYIHDIGQNNSGAMWYCDRVNSVNVWLWDYRSSNLVIKWKPFLDVCYRLSFHLKKGLYVTSTFRCMYQTSPTVFWNVILADGSSVCSLTKYCARDRLE